MIVDCVGIST